MLERDRFHKLIRFVDNIKTLGFNPTDLSIGNDGSYSLYLNHKNDNTNPKIICKEDNDLNIIFDNLSLSMKQSEFANDINSKYDKLLYIDLRFSNKVLYKFQ